MNKFKLSEYSGFFFSSVALVEFWTKWICIKPGPNVNCWQMIGIIKIDVYGLQIWGQVIENSGKPLLAKKVYPLWP